MRPKQDDAKRKPQQHVPSTGRGAASAMEALIKRRVPAAGGGVGQPDGHKKR
jgi:hypothetical protein